MSRHLTLILLMQSIITDHDTGNQRSKMMQSIIDDNLVSEDGENSGERRMQSIITDYHILLPVHFSYSLNCLISYDTFPLM